MKDPASALAELMNQRNEITSAGQPVSAPQETAHIEKVAGLVCELLGAKVKPWLRRKLGSWPRVFEDADDLGQLAALAFVEAYRLGRVRPDPVKQQHTASSVSAYLWGICNKIFIDSVRRSRRRDAHLEEGWGNWQEPQREAGLLEELLPGGPAEDQESRLWEVLSAVKGRCLPQDILMAFLLGCGFTSGEVLRLLRVGVNGPATALRRVGAALREICGLDSGPKRSGGVRTPKLAQQKGAGQAVLTPLDLISQKRYSELVEILNASAGRNLLLSEAVAALGPPASMSAQDSLAARQFAIRASGDWSWGLLPPESRRALLLRNVKLLSGAGVPDEGAAQQAALKELVAGKNKIYEELDQALLVDDLTWLLPLAEHLQVFLSIVSDFKEMELRYTPLLDAASRLKSSRLRLFALLGLGMGQHRLGDSESARDLFKQAVLLSRDLDEPLGEASALIRLANVYWSLADYPRSLETYRQAVTICRNIGDRSAEARSLHGLGLVHHTQGDFDRALELHNLALTIRRQVGDSYGEASSLSNLGAVHGMMGDDPGAAAFYGQGLALCRELGDRRGEAYSLRGLALVHCSQGEYAEAAEKHILALTICRELGDREGERNSLRCLGALYSEQADYTRGAELHRAAVTICRELGDRHGEAESLFDLAIVHSARGEFAEARELYILAIPVFSEVLDKALICISCASASDLLIAQGALRPAAVSLHSAIKQAAVLKLGFDHAAMKPINERRKRLDDAVASGEISAEELAVWRAEGEALGLEELAEFTLKALADVAVDMPPDAGTSKDSPQR